jgi:hypothetical protein
MVALGLALLPLLVGGALYAVDLLSSGRAVDELSVSAAAHPTLAGVAVAAALLAAVRRRRGPRASAWIALLAGILLFSGGELLELFTRAENGWLEELFRVAGFFPLAWFVWQIASPLSIVYWSKRRLRGAVVVGLALFLAVAAIELVAALAVPGGPTERGGALGVLAATRPFLDILLFLPLVVTLAVAGPRHHAEPYLFVGLGVLAELVADIFFHYDVFTGRAGCEQAAFLFTAASLAYFSTAALWCVADRTACPPARPAPEARGGAGVA